VPVCMCMLFHGVYGVMLYVYMYVYVYRCVFSCTRFFVFVASQSPITNTGSGRQWMIWVYCNDLVDLISYITGRLKFRVLAA